MKTTYSYYKKILVFYSFLFFTSSLFSAVDAPSVRVVMYEMHGNYCNAKGENLGDEIEVPENIRFEVLREVVADSQRYFIIKILPIDTVKLEKLRHKKHEKFETISSLFYGDDRDDSFVKGETTTLSPYVRVSAEELENMSEPMYSTRPRPVAGPMVIPVKLRSDPFEFETDVSFGLAVGMAKRTSKRVEDNYIVGLLSFGITALTLDSLTTKGELTESTDLPAFYASAGLVLSLRSSVSLGVFAGVDLLGSGNKNNWIYQGEPWIGVGLGITMFSLKKEEEMRAIAKN